MPPSRQSRRRRRCPPARAGRRGADGEGDARVWEGTPPGEARRSLRGEAVTHHIPLICNAASGEHAAAAGQRAAVTSRRTPGPSITHLPPAPAGQRTWTSRCRHRPQIVVNYPTWVSGLGGVGAAQPPVGMACTTAAKTRGMTHEGEETGGRRAARACRRSQEHTLCYKRPKWGGRGEGGEGWGGPANAMRTLHTKKVPTTADLHWHKRASL